MTSAFAKQLGLAVEYQKVSTDEALARSGDIYLAIDHVNIPSGDAGWMAGGSGIASARGRTSPTR